MSVLKGSQHITDYSSIILWSYRLSSIPSCTVKNAPEISCVSSGNTWCCYAFQACQQRGRVPSTDVQQSTLDAVQFFYNNLFVESIRMAGHIEIAKSRIHPLTSSPSILFIFSINILSPYKRSKTGSPLHISYQYVHCLFIPVILEIHDGSGYLQE
jgi:hypothetical protein